MRRESFDGQCLNRTWQYRSVPVYGGRKHVCVILQGMTSMPTRPFLESDEKIEISHDSLLSQHHPSQLRCAFGFVRCQDVYRYVFYYYFSYSIHYQT